MLRVLQVVASVGSSVQAAGVVGDDVPLGRAYYVPFKCAFYLVLITNF
jgi:hypothetical protein